MTSNPSQPDLAPSAAASSNTPPTSTAATDDRRGRDLHHLDISSSAAKKLLNSVPRTASPTTISSLDDTALNNSPPDRSRTLRRPSPGLLARMKLLDSANKARVVSSPVYGQDKIGRIPESQLRELDEFHRERSLIVERRGREWSGPGAPPAAALLPQTTGTSTATGISESANALEGMESAEKQSIDSDQSSIITTSDNAIPSDSDVGDEVETVTEDNQKYRLPELEKVQSPTTTGASEFGTARIISPGARSRATTAGGSQDFGYATIISNGSTRAPTPPPKDTPLVQSPASPWRTVIDRGSDLESYFSRPARANSVYSLSRVSFTNQILQLTSINLPESDSLASGIRSIPTSTAAGRALGEAANQIQVWIKKASEVLDGLDAEDDVEWAAAAGREGLAEVDAAITRFESLVNVYIGAIEELQAREDIAHLAPKDLRFLASQMDDIITKWSNIKKTLKGVKEQVEIAMEWEELWNSVLGEIGMEIEALNRLVFEMEERRHRLVLSESTGEGTDLELGELETIVEDAPKNNHKASASNRFSFTPAFGSNSPLLSPTLETKHEDSTLLALTARMQPLRASLDFLPMRLQSFRIRAGPNFPTACGELEDRKTTLEGQWMKLEADAEALRRELGEDRWIMIFRNAGAKAFSMWHSTIRSIRKLRMALEENANEDYIASKMRSYKEKKPHYPPAIERVLTIIEKGIKDRLTINGEILRLQTEIQHKLTELHAEIKEMDIFLEEVHLNTEQQQLRDSISTILSTEQSFNSSALDTPGSSPSSSIIMSRMSSDYSPHNERKSRQTSFASSSSRAGSNGAHQHQRPKSGLPTPQGHMPRKTTVTRSSALEHRAVSSPVPNPRLYRPAPPNPNRRLSQQSQSPSRPRWTSSTNLNDTVIGHNFKPLSATTPSPHRKSTPTIRTPHSLRSVGSNSSLPIPSPLSRNSLASPPPSAGPRPASTTPGHLSISSAKRNSAMGSSPITPVRRPGSALKNHSSSSKIPTSNGTHSRSNSLLTPEEHIGENSGEEEASPTLRATKPSRPVSQLGKRHSLLPQPKTPRAVSGTSGRTSRAMEERPRWRG